MTVLIKRLLFTCTLVCMLYSAPALAERSVADVIPKLNYKVFKLPKPSLIIDAGDARYAAYNLTDFRLLLTMDNDYREISESLARSQRRAEALDQQVAIKTVQGVYSETQLQLCLEDRTRITSKWKAAETAKNKAEAKRRGGLFAIAGWTIAGVSVVGLGGLILGIVIQ